MGLPLGKKGCSLGQTVASSVCNNVMLRFKNHMSLWRKAENTSEMKILDIARIACGEPTRRVSPVPLPSFGSRNLYLFPSAHAREH